MVKSTKNKPVNVEPDSIGVSDATKALQADAQRRATECRDRCQAICSELQVAIVAQLTFRGDQAAKTLVLSGYKPAVTPGALTLNVYALAGGSPINASPLTLVESGSVPGEYKATMTETASGTKLVKVLRGASIIGQWLCDLVELVGEYELIAGPTPLQLAAELAGTVVTVSSPITSDGDELTIRLSVGDDYYDGDSRSFDISLSGASLPTDLTDAACDLVCLIDRLRPIVIAGAVIVTTGDTRTVRFSPVAAETILMKPTVDGKFYVRLTTSDEHTITPEDGRGTLIVQQGKSCNELSV